MEKKNERKYNENNNMIDQKMEGSTSHTQSVWAPSLLQRGYIREGFIH